MTATPTTHDPASGGLDAPLKAPDDPLITAVMTPDVVAVAAETAVPVALHLMAAAGVRHLPVVERGACLGVLVETDLIRSLAEAPGPFGTAVPLTAVELRRPAAELPPTARVSEAARRMSVDAVDAVLVTEHGCILGIVTATDLVRLLATCRPDHAVSRRTGPVLLPVTPGISGEVVDTAFRTARERDVPLLAVAVWHDPELPLGGWLPPDRIAGWDAAAQKARRELDRALGPAKRAYPGVEVRMVVADDEPTQFVAALSTKAELLVVGRPIHSELPVHALLDRAACPVLVLPPATPDQGAQLHSTEAAAPVEATGAAARRSHGRCHL